MRVLIIGCGYVGLALGEQLLRQGHEVFGLRRHAVSGGSRPGVEWLTGDVTRVETLRALPSVYDWVIYCVSSSLGTVEDYQLVYQAGVANVLDWLAATPPRKLVYTSSTGVYAQNDGSVVTENSPARPETGTGRALLEAERLLVERAQQSRFPAVILRVAGIYGPGRGYWLRQFLSGEAKLEGTGERWLNMIHRDDVAGAAIAALERGRPGEIYNACDNEPVQILTVFEWLAATLRRPLPPSVPESSSSGSKRGVTSKRISNRKLREECGWSPRYPSFREGYARELAELSGPDLALAPVG